MLVFITDIRIPGYPVVGIGVSGYPDVDISVSGYQEIFSPDTQIS
ncbi:MAG: hypothetical protein V1925_01235 [Candidatus Omnitrophota bacterium]